MRRAGEATGEAGGGEMPGEQQVGGEAAGEGAASEGGERVAGVNLESTPLVVLGVLTGIVLAVVVLLVKDPRVLLAVGAVSVAFAALDLLEFTTRSGERSAVLGVAGALIAVHLFIAALAFWGFSRERAGPAETSPGE